MEIISRFSLRLQIRDKKNRGGYNLVMLFAGTEHLLSGDFARGELIYKDIDWTGNIDSFGLELSKSKIYSNIDDTWAYDSLIIEGITNYGSKFIIRKSDSNHIERNSKWAGVGDHPITFEDCRKVTLTPPKNPPASISEAIMSATVQVKIRDERNRGGYDLVMRIFDQELSISSDFSQGQLLTLDVPWGREVSGLRYWFCGARIYSNKVDTWDYDWVKITGVTTTGRKFFWTKVPTEQIERNSVAAGMYDNPISFEDFNYNWGTHESWMQDNIATLGEKTLREICIPGAHNAGMFELNGTRGGSECNTLTQTKNIHEMLLLGVRYFDIRCVIHNNLFYTGHYSDSWAGTLGGNGVSLDDLIRQLNGFTENHAEVIILNISYFRNSDTNVEFSDEEYKRLFNFMHQRIRYLSQLTASPTASYRAGEGSGFIGRQQLYEIKLKNLIGNGRSCVFVVFDTPYTAANDIIIDYSISPPILPRIANGFFNCSNSTSQVIDGKTLKPDYFYIYDKYADKNKAGNLNEGMIKDQIDKMISHSSSTYFLLSWTLTQSVDEQINCISGSKPSILQLANLANAELDGTIRRVCTPKLFPNIIFLDKIETSTATELCLWINSGCPPVTATVGDGS
ncbi:MAG: hypothetical protein ACRCWO_00855 [Bosea sp. (in: a-proteobacteria)]